MSEMKTMFSVEFLYRKTPPDLTFPSMVIYEGLLNLIHASDTCDISTTAIACISSREPFGDAFSRLRISQRPAIRISMVGTVTFHAEILNLLGANITIRRTYNNLAETIRGIRQNIPNVLYDQNNVVKIDPSIIIKGNRELSIIYDSQNINFWREKPPAAPPLMKLHRYTGFTSLNAPYTTGQIKVQASPQIILLFTIGLLSAFCGFNTESVGTAYYYFLFFSPQQLCEIFTNARQSANAKEFIDKYFRIKQHIVQELREIISQSISSEHIILEILFNVSILSEILSSDIDKIDFVMYNLEWRGREYILRQIIPITVQKSIYAETLIRENFSDPYKFLTTISEFVTNRTIINVLNSLHRRRPFVESSHILRAIRGLYSFLIGGNPSGWYTFIRELDCAYRIVDDERRKEEYKEWLRRFSYLRLR